MDNKSPEIQITLKNGEKVKVNDHVYCSPAWSIRDGTPYSVARIMEFLPPEDKTVTKSSRKGKSRESTYTRARLAWYYRPSDVSDRAVADSRLLLAAIYSEICDISQLRAKCYVIHKDKLANVNEWKRKPDRFYFHRLFDPYIKKEFEVLLSTDVRNLPQHIRDVLISRYEYIVAEKEVVSDLTDSLRLCSSCEEWCAHLDTVQCASCKDHYHMSCVSPPLIAKPSRGYGWTCAKCSMVHDQKVDARGMPTTGVATRESTPRGGAMGRGGRGRGRPRRDKIGTVSNTGDEEMQVKHYKLWPFRYFGLYTIAEDTLDPDDLIFPRAATRVGPKYQAAVAARPGDPVPTTASTSTASLSTILGDIPERGGDSTIEVLSLVNEFDNKDEASIQTAMNKCIVREKQRSSVDFLTEFIRRVCDAKANGRPITSVSMKSINRLEKWKKHETRYTDREWTDEEVAAFEDGISQYGAELRSVRDEVGSRTMPEVVRFYGHWKNSRLGEENARLREPEAYSKAKIPRSPTSTRPNSGSSDGEEDDESIVNVPPSAQGPRSANFCAACRTRDSRVWWKAPKGLTTAILCDTCGVNWRKYADLNARPTTREETAMSSQSSNAASANGNGVSAPSKNREKREGTPLTAPAAKRAKVTGGGTSSVSAKSTPPPALNLTAQYQCLSCYRNDVLGKVLKCRGCGISLHAGACGSESMKPEDVESWLCELCENEKTQEYSLNTNCLLCPREAQGAKNGTVVSDTYLRACKPTEGQGWVHALCSVFMPEITYSDAAHLRVVEGISTIPEHRWTTKCCLCNLEGGAVVKCGNCPKEYHVSCAWKYGHKFGFEIQPVKSSRRDMTSVVSFKKETGAMNAVICCKDHASYRRQTYDLCDTNDNGESALQIFARTYKQAETDQAHSLLRKAQRLDQLLHAYSSAQSETSSVSSVMDVDARRSSSPNGVSSIPAKPECKKCKTQYSPFFHRLSSSPNDMVCHRCFFVMDKDKEKGKDREGKMEGIVKMNGINGTNGLNGVNGGTSDLGSTKPVEQGGLEIADVVMSIA